MEEERENEGAESEKEEEGVEKDDVPTVSLFEEPLSLLCEQVLLARALTGPLGLGGT